jgi:hypothetical protein
MLIIGIEYIYTLLSVTDVQLQWIILLDATRKESGGA